MFRTVWYGRGICFVLGMIAAFAAMGVMAAQRSDELPDQRIASAQRPAIVSVIRDPKGDHKVKGGGNSLRAEYSILFECPPRKEDLEAMKPLLLAIARYDCRVKRSETFVIEDVTFLLEPEEREKTRKMRVYFTNAAPDGQLGIVQHGDKPDMSRIEFEDGNIYP